MKKGQVSIEFLMITGIAMLILASATFFMFSYTQSSSERNAITQVSTLGYNLVAQAKNMYIFGEGSFVTVETSMPDQLSHMYVVENSTLVFVLQTGRGPMHIPIFADVPINGTNRYGVPKVNVSNATQTLHSGRSAFRVESMGSWVEISQTT